MAVETELKFNVPAARLKALAKPRFRGGKIGAPTEHDLVSTYFDTAKHKLKRHGLTLRVRRDGNSYVQTIKSANGAQFGRSEWETEIKDNAPDLGQADDTPLEPFASKKLRRKLKPVFESSVHRTTVPLRIRRSDIELAIDRGHIVAGHRSTPIQEAELELKSGRPVDLFRIAKELERKSQAELDVRSKADLGYSLARGKEEQVVFAEDVELEPDTTAGAAFRVIARASFRHFSANVDAVRNGDAEGVHQMRVGLRRLRAAISLFSKALSGAGTDRIKQELKWLTNELAPARELDVFVKENIEPAKRDALLRRGGKAIQKEFAARRDRAFARAREAVNSEPYRSLLIDTLQWIEADRTIARDDTKTPIRKFAVGLLHRRIKKLRKQGRRLDRLDKMSAQERHKLRIGAKKIRYGLEFFASIFQSKREQKRLDCLSKHLKKIQNALGSLNDFVAHRDMAVDAALKAPAPRGDGRARAFASGVVLGREDQAVRPLVKVAAREVRGLEVI